VRVASTRTPLHLSGRSPNLPGLVMSPVSYIDPGSGSLFLQALAGGVAAVGVTTRLYWRRIKRVLHIGKTEDESAPS
jgi:hypothetical protein